LADRQSATHSGDGPANGSARPPLAVVGSQISHDEDLFGQVFDKWVVRRFLTYLRPYRRKLYLAIGAVLVFTLTQLSIPLIVRAVIDDALVAENATRAVIDTMVMVFVAVITVNYVANHIQETVVGKVAEHLLFDLRRAMYAHLQVVSLSFMDKTEVGRLMSRLQGDVYALQEFLESSIFAIGDLVLLLGIIAALLSLDFQLGVMTLSVVPILFLVRIVWLPYARRAFLWARETSSATNAALAENIHGIRAVQEMGREAINYDLFDEKATENLNAHLSASKFSNVMIPIVDTLTGGALAIVVIVGGGLVLDEALDIGIMVAFVFYVQRFFDPIRSLTIQYSMMQRAMAAGQRIFEVLDVARSAGAQGHFVQRRARRDRRPGWSHRFRQDEHHRPGTSFL
jgi:ATP-binding cassette subfamily B protein